MHDAELLHTLENAEIQLWRLMASVAQNYRPESWPIDSIQELGLLSLRAIDIHQCNEHLYLH